MSNSNIHWFGIGFFEAMFLLFLGLKLGKVIDWSWWWIFAPLWAPLLIIVIFIILFLIGYGIYRLIRWR